MKKQIVKKGTIKIKIYNRKKGSEHLCIEGLLPTEKASQLIQFFFDLKSKLAVE